MRSCRHPFDRRVRRSAPQDRGWSGRHSSRRGSRRG
jgi:hypothetical protein